MCIIGRKKVKTNFVAGRWKKKIEKKETTFPLASFQIKRERGLVNIREKNTAFNGRKV